MLRLISRRYSIWIASKHGKKVFSGSMGIGWFSQKWNAQAIVQRNNVQCIRRGWASASMQDIARDYWTRLAGWRVWTILWWVDGNLSYGILLDMLLSLFRIHIRCTDLNIYVSVIPELFVCIFDIMLHPYGEKTNRWYCSRLPFCVMNGWLSMQYIVRNHILYIHMFTEVILSPRSCLVKVKRENSAII